MWTRLNSNKYYDHEGNLARKGSINKIILNQSLENFYDNQISSKKSFDISDFDLSFVRGLSLEDGLQQHLLNLLQKYVLKKYLIKIFLPVEGEEIISF